MAFVIPTQHRITPENMKSFGRVGKELLDIVDVSVAEPDGFYAIPKPNNQKGFGYLVKLSTVIPGWISLGISIPHDVRTPTWEEIHYVRCQFFDDEVCMILMPGANQPRYWAGTNLTVHLFIPTHMPKAVQDWFPPVYDLKALTFRDAGFFKKLVRNMRRGWKEMWDKPFVAASDPQNGVSIGNVKKSKNA